VVTGNVYVTSGLFWSNGTAFSSGSSSTFTSGNVVAASGTASVSTTTGALVIAGAGGLGVGGDLNTNAGSTVAGWTVGGLLWAACTTPATSAISGGGLLVSGGARFTGNVYASGNIYLGANTSSNLVANATTTSTSTTTGALVVRGGMGVAGNVYSGGNVVVTNGIFSSNLSVSTALSIAGAGSFSTSGVSYLLERALITATAPATSVDIDILTQSVFYWTANAVSDSTANIRGNSTTPLNSILAIGQSVSVVVFFPNGASNYYVNTIKIDNTTVTPAYQGNASPALGNSNSIDIYSFTILKTASATYKVFASQTQFMHPG
jgi:hypothetical protein